MRAPLTGLHTSILEYPENAKPFARTPGLEIAMALLDPDRLFPTEPRSRATRARALRVRSATCRSSARTATPIRAGIAENAALPRSRAALRRPRPLRLPHALLAGRAARRPRRAPRRRRPGRDRRPHDLAPLRRELPPLPRHPDAAVARPHLRDAVRPRPTACPPRPPTLLRPHRRLPRRSRTSARAPSSSASTSRRSPPPKARSTTCAGTR